MLLKKNFVLSLVLMLVGTAQCFAGANFTIKPLRTLPTHVLPGSTTVLPFLITNQTSSTRSNYTLSTLPPNVKQLYSSQTYTDKLCGNPFSVPKNGQCLLLLSVTGAASFDFSVCSGASCTRSAVSIALQSADTISTFPYGVAPTGGVPITLSEFKYVSQYATPETMLGSWAMQQAIINDTELTSPQQLPANTSLTLDKDNTVYAVGTAAVGSFYASSLNNCDNGCNELNGQCFAIRFNNKTDDYKYMIFQSVNTAANKDSFDVYMAGGGAGANPEQCPTFWNAGAAQYSCPGTGYPNFFCNIGNIGSGSPCDTYFVNTTTSIGVSSPYTVTDGGVTYQGVDTLVDACVFALPPSMSSLNSQKAVTSGTANFNMGAAQDGTDANFYEISAVPLEACPQYLTQVTGLVATNSPNLLSDSKTLADLTESDFDNAVIQIANDPSLSTGGNGCYSPDVPLPNGCPATTQMQDCATPSGGWSQNVSAYKTNYSAYFSASITLFNSGGTAPYVNIPGTYNP